MEQKKIDRINEFVKISKVRNLTDEELKERETLRREYIDSYKKSLICEMQNTYIVDEKGNKKKVKKRSK